MEALLIVDGRPNETLSRVLEALGVADEIGPGWPRADLDVSRGVAIRCDDWDGLAELIERRPGAKVMAFYTGPLEDLDQIGGTTVSHLGRRYALQRPAVKPAIEPYAHRLITLERRGVGAEGGSLERPEDGAAGNLILCPVAVSVDVEQMAAVGFSSSQINGILFPPLSVDTPAAYFENELIGIRRQLRNYLAEQVAREWNPAALSLLDVVDRPDLRPFLSDGGCLRLVADDKNVTCLVLDTASLSPVPAYRTAFYEADQPGRRGLGAVRTCLRADLLNTSPGLAIGRTQGASSWDEYELRGYRASDRSTGSWQTIRLLLHQLRAVMSSTMQERLDRRILDLSSGRNGDNPDHGLAEEGLIRDLARVPWAPHSPNWSEGRTSVWTDAIIALFLREFAEQLNLPASSTPPWLVSGSDWELDEHTAFSIYYPTSEAERVFRWRLHAPVGTAFHADEWSRVGDGRTTRLGETLRLR